MSSKIPSSIYRLQLNEQFRLKEAIAILPYLKELGIEGIYCSPFYKSTSLHGYDVTNPNQLNPLIGTEAEFDLFCSRIKKLGLFFIIDVVPNHMGFKKGQNNWWQDVLENGPYSEYASFFDIDWSPDKKELQDKVLLPILGESYGDVLENQQIKLSFADGRFLLHYSDFPLPVAPHTYAQILELGHEELKGLSRYNEYLSLIEFYRQFPVSIQERALKKEEGKKQLKELIEKVPAIGKFIQKQITLYNGKKRLPESFNLLDKLLESQFYRLSFWKVAGHEINFRRFFNIHELIAICIEKQTVFEAHHHWILELLKQKKAQGFRIDHPDGLYDPVTYFLTLREKGCRYTIVEKILERQEELPSDWEVEGTVGYEYLNLLSGLFIRKSSKRKFTQIYDQFLGEPIDYDEVVYQSKLFFVQYHMVSEVESLARRLDRISEKNRHYRDLTRFDLTTALQQVIACFPVYRTYIGPKGGVSKRDIKYIRMAIAKAKKRTSELDSSIFDFLEKLLLLKLPFHEKDGYREFILRFQQLTGPIMAKGLEDTAFYIYNRFISLNEVGGDPLHFGNTVEEFHHFNQRKKERWPFGFLASSTHDTKRSEDVRMRLNVLSEMPEEWEQQVEKWSKINGRTKKANAPSRNLEYFLYQTLIGIWPHEDLTEEGQTLFFDRIWAVLLKSMREAQLETSWNRPNLEYEENVRYFLHTILTLTPDNEFLHSFLPFQKKIDYLGGWNSLSLTGLKIASCGVVDIYQGNETWNYSLVDPDNRKAVDFKKLEKDIQVLRSQTHNDFEQIKSYLIWKGLTFRREHKDLFLEGEYIPLKVIGKRKEHLIAFARKKEDRWLIVCALRFFTPLVSPSQDWKTPPLQETFILLPDECQKVEWTVLFSSEKQPVATVVTLNQKIRADSLFECYPVSYLYG